MISDIPYVIYEDKQAADDQHFFQEHGLACLTRTPPEGPWFGRKRGVFTLFVPRQKTVTETSVDFSDPALLYRLKTSGKRQGIGQAVGLNRQSGLTVIDGTAGLGRDAFILAGLGCTVITLERNPLIHRMLQDGLHRALETGNSQVREICSRLSLFHSDTREWLDTSGSSVQPDVIYLDPMFPHRTKSASVKKDIAGLQYLAAPDEDITDVLLACLKYAKRRVVVKRPRSRDRSYFEGRVEPILQLSGKSVQYDVFTTQNS